MAEVWRYQAGENIVITFERNIEDGHYTPYYTFTIAGHGPMYDKVEDMIPLDGASSNLLYYIHRVFQEDLIIGEGIETIADRLFYGLGHYYARNHNNKPGINRVIIGGRVWKIGNYSFDGSDSAGQYDGINTFEIRSEVTDIGVGAFYNQVYISAIDFHEHVLRVMPLAFYNCQNLYVVNLNDDWECTPDPTGEAVGGRFAYCYKMNDISPRNYVPELTQDNYYECRYLTRLTIRDVTEFPYDVISQALKVTRGTGKWDCLDEDGYLITEVANFTPIIAVFDWKQWWGRVFAEYYWDENKVYLYHEGHIIEIKMYKSGDLPLSHEDLWWFLRWAEGHENPTHSCLHVAHNGKWYQIKY